MMLKRQERKKGVFHKAKLHKANSSFVTSRSQWIMTKIDGYK